MYEINYTMFFVCSILLGKIKKAENGVIQLIPKSLRDVTVSVMEEIVEAGREHFSDSLIGLVDSLCYNNKGVFYILDNYQEMKDIHGDIVDEVIIQASQFCCQYYRSNQAVLDELIGSESVSVVKACSVSDDSSIQDHINFIRAFSMAGMYIVVAGDAENIIKGELIMQNKSQENQKKENTSQDQTTGAQQDQTVEQEAVQAVEEAAAVAADSLAAVVEHADVKVSRLNAPEGVMMLGRLNLLDPGGVLSRGYQQQKIQEEKDRLEKEIRAKAKEKAKANSGKWYKLGLGKDAKTRREALKKEIADAIDAAHARVDAAYAA